MGRRKGSLNKKTLAKMGLLPSSQAPVVDKRTDDQIVQEIRDQFNIYLEMIRGVLAGHITSLIVTGSPGVGKSHTVEWAFRQHLNRNPLFRYQMVRGAISGIGLYEVAYRYRGKGNVIVLDDADRVYYEEDSLNVLKVLLDTSVSRVVSWNTDHARFKGDDALPKEFEFQGAMIFLTNRDLQKEVDFSNTRFTDHMKALMSRSNYLDLKMHDKREVALWAREIITVNKVLQGLGLPAAQEQRAVNWIVENHKNLREVSIRTAIKLGRYMMMNPKMWETRAKTLLLR